MRRTDGRVVLFTEQAVAVFEAARRHDADVRSWTVDRAAWLRLAASVGAPEVRRKKLATAAPSAAVVEASRDLYVAAAERTVKAARRDRRWVVVAEVRRAEAAALHRDAGSPVPPSETLVALHREGTAAVLRSLVAMGPEAELVSAGCCPACRADDGLVVKIAAELRDPRLPHAGCPKGLCACDWWIAVAQPRSTRRRRRQPRSTPADSGGQAE